MKQKYKWLIGALATSFMLTTSCVDEIKFGNSFLDMAAQIGGVPLEILKL